MKKVSSCKSIKFNRKLNASSKKDLNKQFNQFQIKELDYEKEAESKVINIETLDYVPMCNLKHLKNLFNVPIGYLFQ